MQSHSFSNNMALVHRLSFALEEARVYNAHSPVFRLSNDVLESILLDVASSSPFTKATDAAMKLSQVCHRWRAVALHSGRLWARISGGPKLFELILARSLSAPLYLTLDIRHVEKTNLVFGQIDRIVAMSLFVASDVVATGSQNAPVLRTLALNFAPGMRDSAYLVGWNMPKLERLLLAHTSLTNKGHLLVGTLTTLALTGVNCHAAGAPGSSLFSRFISLLGRLKSLRLASCLSGECLGTLLQHAPIRLSALETLCVIDAPELCLGFIRRLQMPSIISLSLDFSACIHRKPFPRELALEIRRHVLERGGNAGRPAAMHTVAFNSIDGRFSLAYWNARSTDMEPLPDSKSAIRIVFHDKDDILVTTEMATQLALRDVKCLRVELRAMGGDHPLSFVDLAPIFPRTEKLVVGPAAYGAALAMFGMDSYRARNSSHPFLLPSLTTLVMMNIWSGGDCVNLYRARAQSFVRSLKARKQVEDPIRKLVIKGCSVFCREDIEEIRPLVHELLWDGKTMDWER